MPRAKKNESKDKKVSRSAGNGKFVSEEEAKANPAGTVTETVKDNDVPKDDAKDEKAEYLKGTRFFRSRIDGLRVPIKDANPVGESDPDLVEYVQFHSYVEKYQGDAIRVGYLATDNPRAIKVFSDDPMVSEIDQDEYEKATSQAKRVR